MAANGFRPSVARPAAKVTACCSAMPTSKVRSGNCLGEAIEAGAVGHGRGDGDDLVVLLRLGDKSLGEYARVARCLRLADVLRACDDVELADAVVLVVGRLGGCVALALLGDDVDEDRSLARVAHVLQDGQQVIEVVTVDRPYVVKPELLEPGAALPQMPRVFLHARGTSLPALRQLPRQLLGDVAQIEIRAAR